MGSEPTRVREKRYDRVADQRRALREALRERNPERLKEIESLEASLTFEERFAASMAAHVFDDDLVKRRREPVRRLARLWREEFGVDDRENRAPANALEVFGRDPKMRQVQDYIRRTDPARFAEMESLSGDLSLGENLAALHAGWSAKQSTALDEAEHLGEKTKRLAELWRGASLPFEAFFPRSDDASAELPASPGKARVSSPRLSKRGGTTREDEFIDSLVYSAGEDIGGIPRRQIIQDALAGTLPRQLERFSDEEDFHLMLLVREVIEKRLLPDEIKIAMYLPSTRLTDAQLAKLEVPLLVREYARYERERTRLFNIRNAAESEKLAATVKALARAVCKEEAPSPTAPPKIAAVAPQSRSTASQGWVPALLRVLGLTRTNESFMRSRVAIVLLNEAGEPVDDLLTVEQARAILGLSQQRLSQLMAEGTLRRHEIGPRFFAVERKQVEEYARQDRRPGPKSTRF